MPGQEMALITELLQEEYGELHVAINTQTPLVDETDTADSDGWEGDAYVESVHKGRNMSSKAASETGLMPAAGRQTYAEVRVPLRRQYGVINVTGQLIEQSRSNVAKFANPLDQEIMGMVTDMRREKERIVMGDGRGILALMNGAGDGTPTFTVDSPGGVAGADFGNRFIFPNMILAFHDSSGTEPPNLVATVSEVNTNGLGVTMGENVSAANAPNNGWVTKGAESGATMEGSANLECMGIRGIFDDGTFVTTLHNINRSTAGNEFWEATVFSSVGQLSEDLLHRAQHAAEERSGYVPDRLWCHNSVFRKYIQLGVGDRRFTGEQANRFDVGIDGKTRTQSPTLTFSGDQWRRSRYFDLGTIIMFLSGSLKRLPLQPGRWVDDDGSIFHRGTTKDDFEARYRVMENMTASSINSSVCLRGITATVDINREAA